MGDFTISDKGIDPDLIPKSILYTGCEIPMIGLGTFGSDSVSGQQVADAVKGAISVGYRHIDCASVYGNEKEIGQTLNEVLRSGLIRREQLWITSKVWNDMHDKVVESCKQSLADLRLKYLDLYLV